MNGIEARALEKHFGPVRALQGIDLSIEAGSLVRVAGANGAGKTTLLRILAGLERPTRGTVGLGGRDPFGRKAASVRGRIGFLGPTTALYGELTLRENLRFISSLHGLSEERTPQLLAALSLSEVGDREVRTLSQGFRRRAGLARALLTEPAWLFLDEPWNGRDRAAGEQLTHQLRAGREAGRTTLVASHAEPTGPGGVPWDRVLELESGRLRETHR